MLNHFWQRQTRDGAVCKSMIASAAFAIGASACGPPPAPAAPLAASATAPSSSAPAARNPTYNRDRDPMSASYDHEKNPFMQLMMAKMWVVVARLEAGEGTLRMAAAKEALDESLGKVAAVEEPCAKAARAALDWASATKQSMERRYLNSVDLLGDQNIGTKVVDAEVTVLRDEIDVLERRMQGCPKQYFGPEDR